MAPHAKFTAAEEAEIWKFVAVNPHRHTIFKMFGKYREEGLTERSYSSLCNRYSKYLIHSLHNAEIDMITKAKIYMIYRIRPTPDYLALMREEIGVAVDEQGYVVHYNGIDEEEIVDEVGRAREASGDASGEESDRELLTNGRREEVVADDNEDEEEVAEGTSSTSVAAYKRSASPLPVRNAKHYKTGESSSNHQVDDYEMAEGDDHQNGGLSEQQQQDLSQHVDYQSLMGVVKDAMKEVFAAEAKEMVTLALNEEKKRIEAEKKNSLANEQASMKSYMAGMKRLVCNMNSPSLDHIEHRIDNALTTLNEADQSVSIDSVRSVLDVALKMFGH